MRKEILKKPTYVEEILAILRSGYEKEELLDRLSDYHESDIADALELLSEGERKKIYPILGTEYVAEIFSYMEDAAQYLREINLGKAVEILSEMDSDDAVDILEDLDEEKQKKIVDMLETDAREDIQMILSYTEEEIGSEMTTNFISIEKKCTIRQAMRELVLQAGEHDNISTIYVTDEEEHFYGAIELKDLIVAREYQDLEELIQTSYPYVKAHDKIEDCIERLKDYAEDSIPVLSDEEKILGVITAHDIVQAVEEAMGDDYAKLGGLTAGEDLKETTVESMKKRLPWLIALLFLGMGISSVVGVFEMVVAALPIIICFQSLILDMAGNVGTQSLAVTIRVLMDENMGAKDKVALVMKELKVGFCNGVFLGVMAFLFIGLYVFLLKGKTIGYAFQISGCVGVALLISIVISSLVGTLTPLFFHKIKVDPAVASGPLITTVNDFVAVVTYYGLAWVFLIQVLN